MQTTKMMTQTMKRRKRDMMHMAQTMRKIMKMMTKNMVKGRGHKDGTNNLEDNDANNANSEVKEGENNEKDDENAQGK